MYDGETYQVNMNNGLIRCSPKELNIRERFKTDYKISCPVVDDKDSFYKSLDIFNVRKEWDDYFSMALRYEDFDEYRNDIRNQIVKAISSVEGYDQLEPEKIEMKHGPYKGPRSYLRKELEGHRLISFDLVKGNFQSLRYLDPKYVLGCESYYDLVSKYTEEPCLVDSKMFRQMIFGLLNPKVQFQVQRKIIYHLINNILEKFPDKELEHLTSDEVVFKVNDDDEVEEMIEIMSSLCEEYGYQIKYTEFAVRWIKNDYNDNWFVKTVKGKDKIMGVHVRYLFQVSNWLNGEMNQMKDFWWRERGKLCCLMEAEKLG